MHEKGLMYHFVSACLVMQEKRQRLKTAIPGGRRERTTSGHPDVVVDPFNPGTQEAEVHNHCDVSSRPASSTQ